jgi:hypothetical protein
MAFLSPVLDSMKTFSGDDGVIIEACYLVSILCKHEQLRNQIDDAKVGTSLMEVYDNTNNERTHDMAKEAMKLLLQ